MLGGLSRAEERLLERLPAAPRVSDVEVLEFIRKRQLSRKAIGWVDAHLLASALSGRAELWSFDHALEATAKVLHVAFRGA